MTASAERAEAGREGVQAGGGAGRTVKDGDALWWMGSLIEVKASAQTTGGGYELWEHVLPLGYAPPLHSHRDHDEAYYLLEGELVSVCGERERRLAAGDFVHLPRQVPHSFRVTGTGPVRLLALSAPAGALALFAEGGEPAAERVLPAFDPRHVERIKTIAPRHGVTIYGPPPV